MRRLPSLALAAYLVSASVSSFADDVARNSVVKITATLRTPDPFRPWMKQPPREVSGTGVVIRDKRILTNAHVILYASQVQVQPFHSSNKLDASVMAVAPGIDLASLKLEDESFFDSHPPLATNPVLPKERDEVSVYGYPVGGSDLSVTRGIISRIEFTPYSYLTSGLRIQVDAALNPGNSGGPALVGDRMVGIALSRLSNAERIGYIIPTEEVELFLGDIGDGKYDGKPALIDELQILENPALRGKFGIAEATKGVLVRKPFGRDGDSPLKAGDVISRIGEQPLDNAGMVRVDDHPLHFKYLVQKEARDGHLGLTVRRGGEELKVSVPVGPGREKWLTPYLMGGDLSYFIYGPLAFTESTDEYVRILYELKGAPLTLSFQGNPLVTRYGDRPTFEGERLVIVPHPMFPHRIGRGYQNPFMQAVESVNGVRIRNLKHMVETLRDLTGDYAEFRFLGNKTDVIVFKHDEALRTTEEILSDNGIRQRSSADLAAVWKESK